ncbi:MAG: amidohydrolase [Lachnospiraceae bacterium]|nr:amidohydrolase [Lachnospiraceae bacterium]
MGILIKNAHILGTPENERADVYITENRITGINKEPRSFLADEVIDASHKTLMPGLVNCHTHAYMSLMRNYADDVPFAEWLFDKIVPVEDSLSSEDGYWGNMLSIIEMIRTGTTTFMDMQMFPRMAVKACADSGMRAVISRGIQGESRHDEGAKRRLAEAFDEMEYGRSIGAPCTFALGPHAIYTCGEDLLRYVAELAKEKDMLVTTHLSETQNEFDTCLKEHGCTPTEYMEQLGLLDTKIVFAHCVYLSDHDYELLARPNVYAATNPASNMKLANGFAPVPRMLKEGVNVCLGTDSAASNNALNMFGEMHLLSMAQKGQTKDALAVTAEETIRIATKNGADALGLDRLGSVEVGKTADLILIDENYPNLRPLYNRQAALVYSATGNEVSDVIINGRVVMRNKNLTTIDEEKVYYETEKIAARFR